MFTHYKSLGFIVGKTDRGESDRIFTVFTEDFGKLELLARAERKIKSKLRAGLEMFYLSEIEFIQGKAHKTLTDAVLIENFKNIRKSLRRLKAAYEISGLLDRLIKGQESDIKIWQLLNETLREINAFSLKPMAYNLIYHYFLWNLLSVLGYQQELYSCSLCQKKIIPENIFFSPKDGGLICAQCGKTTKPAREIAPDAVKVIRFFLKNDWPTLKKLKIDQEILKSLKKISKYYLSAALEQLGD